MTQAISSIGVELCDRWNDGRSSRVAWDFKLITETEPSIYLWAYILNCCMFYELEQPAETEVCLLLFVHYEIIHNLSIWVSIPDPLNCLIVCPPCARSYAKMKHTQTQTQTQRALHLFLVFILFSFLFCIHSLVKNSLLLIKQSTEQNRYFYGSIILSR